MGKPVTAWSAGDYERAKKFAMDEAVPEQHRMQLRERMGEYEARNFSAGFPSSSPGPVTAPLGDRDPVEELPRRKPAAPERPRDDMASFDADLDQLQADVEAQRVNRNHGFLASGRAEFERYVPWYTPDVVRSGGSSVVQADPDSWHMAARKVWEPTIEEYVRDNPGTVGKDGQMPSKDSAGYRIYADRRWADAYERARESGEAVVRAEYLPAYTRAQGGAMNKLAGAAMSVSNSLQAFGLGALEGATLGLGPEIAASASEMLGGRSANDGLADMARVAQDHRVADVSGNIGGAVVGGPGALGAKAAALAPKTAPLLGRVMLGAGVGSTTAVVEGGIQDSVHALADKLRNGSDGDKWSAYDANASFNPLAGGIATDRAMMGAAFGAGGELIATGAKAMVSHLRDPKAPAGRALRDLEDFHNERMTTASPSGIKKKGELEALWEGDPGVQGGKAKVANDLAAPLLQKAHADRDAAQGRFDDFFASYARTAEGRERFSSRPVVEVMERYIREHRWDDGKPYAFAGNDMGKAFMDMVEVKPVPRGARPDGGLVLAGQDIEKMFGPAGRDAVKAAGGSVVPPRLGSGPGAAGARKMPGDEQMYAIVPREMSAAELARQTALFDSYANVKANQGGGKEKVIEDLSSEFRKMRRNFRSNSVAPPSERLTFDKGGRSEAELTGFAAKYERLRGEVDNAGSKIREIGGDPNKKRYSENDGHIRAAVAQKLTSAATPQGAERQLASAVDHIFRDMPEMRKQLRLVQVSEDYRALREAGRAMNLSLTSGMQPVGRISRILDVAAMWSDPMFVKMSRTFGEPFSVAELHQAWQRLPMDTRKLVRGVSTMPWRLGTVPMSSAFQFQGGAAGGIWALGLDTPTVDDVITTAGLAQMGADLDEYLGGKKTEESTE